MVFRFQDGDGVALRTDRHRFLPAGSQGVVFCQYTTSPLAYEVNFQDVRGEAVGAVVEADEIELVNQVVASTIRSALEAA